MTTVNYGSQGAASRDTMHLRIAQWTIALQLQPAALAPVVHARFADFATAAERPDLRITIEAETPAGPDRHATSILQAGLTAMGEDYLLDSPDAYGMIGPSRGLATLRLRSDEPSRETEYFLRVVLALFALPRDGLLVHCAALKRANRVYLFIGQSGSGKSTVVALSRAARRATALGDDLIMVRREGEQWQAYGTPFWNLEAAQRQGQDEWGPVARIYKLIQDHTVFAEPMSRAAATAELVANCPIVNDQPALLPALIERCRAVVSATPVDRLHFRKDDAFWDVIA